GVAAGAGVAALLRSRAASQGPHHETAIVGLLSYLTYLASDLLGLSGILSLFCCGATVSHFAMCEQPRGGPHGTGGAAGGALRSAAGAGHPAHDGGGASAAAAAAAAVAPEPWDWHVRMESPRPHAGAAGGGAAPASSAPPPGGGMAGDPGPGRMPPLGDEPQDGAGGGWGSDLPLWAAEPTALAANALRGGGCMSPAGAAACLDAFHSLSYVAEGLIFIYLGMDCLDPVRW
ncbi:hypothetical protein TSOC_015193, partial [Tetrabaena socialis]